MLSPATTFPWKKYLAASVFAVVTLLIMFPLYRPGFIFLLDMVWPPVIHLNTYFRGGITGPSVVFLVLLKFFSTFISTAILQKLLLSLLLWGMGFSMYRLARRFMPMGYAMLGWLLYMVNPWVYERFLAGQWLVLLGYAVLPLYLIALLRVLQKPTKPWIFVGLAAIYPTLSLHFAYMAFGLTIVITAVYIYQHFTRLGRDDYRSFARVALLAALVMGIVNIYWLVNFFAPSSTFTGISQNDFAAFQTRSDPTVGPYVNSLGLYGFWGSDYSLPKDVMPLWWLYPLGLVTLSVLGARALLKQRDLLGTALAILFVPVVIVAVGYADPISRAITNFLFHVLPGFKGLRETNKALGLLALCYAVFVPLGVQWMTMKVQNMHLSIKRPHLQTIVLSIAFAVVVSMTSSMFFGFSGQVKPADYPPSWYQAEKTLAADSAPKTVLFLPWHGYMNLSFADFHNVANPAPQFFSAPVIAGQNIDNVYLKDTAQPEWDQVMFNLLQGVSTFDQENQYFRDHGITYIVLAKEADWDRYGWLNQSSTWTKISEDKRMTLYARNDTRL